MIYHGRTPKSQTKANQSSQAVIRLEDGGGGSAAEAAGRVERIDAEELVDEAAGDAEHGGTAVLALSVELEGLDLRVIVAHPRVEGDVASLAVRVLRLRGEASAGLLHAGQHHDLEPAGSGDGLEGGEEASRDISELEVLRDGEVARDTDASLDGDDVEEAKHGRAAVLDLHDLVAAHVALREHGDGGGARGAHGGRGLEGLDGLEK